jgi:Ca-activated chloride channel family protein
MNTGATHFRFTRHAPALLVLLGLASLLLAIARPQAILLLPSRIDTVMLAIDSSGSMRASDVQPSRIEAAQAAAKSFVLGQPGQVKLGVVSVAGAAALVQGPTDQRDLVIQAIEQLSLQPGSALGSGIVIALHAMLPGSGLDVRGLIEGESSPQASSGAPLGGATSTPTETASASGAAPRKPVSLPKVPPGSNTAAAIVLLSDGQSNVGPDAVKMAQVAADLGVRVYTVGVGTAQGTVLKAQGMQMRVKLDETSLKKIAEITKAEYFSADNRQELLQIYQSLSSKIVLKKHRRTEVSALCALLGMLLLTWGCAWAWWRHGRII